ncbi:cysteine proteinase [Ramaria rubella]|nr:cysteine proteinase [Ramaria rubella]
MMQIKSGLTSFYSTAQVQSYLQRINFGDLSTVHPNLKNLQQLVTLHLLAFPFENTQLHYTTTHEIDVTPEVVYNRLVANRQGGSWCCGQNGLFLGMLRGLGYRAYAVSGRVNLSPPSEEARSFTFLSHMALIVQLDEETAMADITRHETPQTPESKTYLVDVGFGGTGIVRPMLLETGRIVPGPAPPEEHRLIRGTHPESSLCEDESSRLWVLQYRCGSHQPWSHLYIFDERETYPSDWVAYSQWLCAHPVALFKQNVLCVRHFIDTHDNDGLGVRLGRLVLIGTRVQRRVGEETHTVREISTEIERLQILKEDFGITIEHDDIQNITGTSAALPPF